MDNKKLFLFMFTFFCLLNILLANNLTELFNRANEAYRAENYEEAINNYRDILSQGYENAAVYYNLGNAYYRLNQIGEAILNYEKAKKLDPNNRDIQYNLELANLRVIDRIEMPPRFFLFEWWDAVKYYYSVYQLRNLVVGLFMAAVFLLIIWLFVRQESVRRFILTLTYIFGFLTLFFVYIFVARLQEYREIRQAVVLSPSVTVYSAPDETSTEVFILHEGFKVSVDEQRTVWIKISLPDGKTGWTYAKILGII